MKNCNWLIVALTLGVSVIAVPHFAVAKDTKTAVSATALLDLNTATVDQLNALPGIGAVKAKAIVDGRPYASVDDLLAKGIVSKSAYDKFKDQVTVGGGTSSNTAANAKPKQPAPTMGPVDLNTATVDELNALPGVGAVKAKAIVDGRPYSSMDDFLSKGIVSKSAYGKFKDQVTVGGGASSNTATNAKPKQPAPSMGPVDLNTATVNELNALPGIGAVKAKALVDGRPYSSMDDFLSKGIVSKSAYDKFKDQVTVSGGTTSNNAKKVAATTGQPAASGTLVDLNTATIKELNDLPGIGEVKAKSIIQGRPYASMNDFVSRGLVSKSAFDKFKDQVTVAGGTATSASNDSADASNPPEPTGPIDINTASLDELEALPGIGPVKAKSIVEGRPYASLADFESKGIVPKSSFDKFKGAIEVIPVAKAGNSKSASDTSTQQGTPGQIAAHKRIKMCGAQWRAAKASGDIPAGQKWPQYWSQCNTRLKQQGY